MEQNRNSPWGVLRLFFHNQAHPEFTFPPITAFNQYLSPALLTHTFPPPQVQGFTFTVSTLF